MNIQNEVQKIHHQYGISEKTNYEIEKLFDAFLKFNNTKIKQEFTLKIQNEYLSDMDKLDDAVASLPNCYAKGYIAAKLGALTNSTDDIEEIKEQLLKWVEYNIWK